jgi:hypothetical protein
MPGRNGAAPAADDPLDLGDLIPRTKTITLLRNGKKTRIEAFVFTTAPVSVYAKIAQAHDAYMAVMRDEGVYRLHQDQAQSKFYADIVRALTDDELTLDEADRLGGDYALVTRVLTELEYLKPREAAPEGEAPAAVSTSEGSSPSSEPSTAATTPTG